MTRNLAVEFRIAANTLRRLADHSDPKKAAMARRILDDRDLFREFVERRRMSSGRSVSSTPEGDSPIGVERLVFA